MELPRVLEYPTKAEHRNAGDHIGLVCFLAIREWPIEGRCAGISALVLWMDTDSTVADHLVANGLVR
jgi:hypothetical protein